MKDSTKKPVVAVVGSSDKHFKKCHDDFLKLVCRQLRQRGAKVVEFDLHVPVQADDALFWRDWVAQQLETLAQMHGFDALLFVPWSINAMAGFAMSQPRLNRPALLLPHYRLWNLDHENYDACSFALLCEILGLLRWQTWDHFRQNLSAQASELSADVCSLVAWTTDKIIELAFKKNWKELRLNEQSLQNALRADMALGGSVLALLQIEAIARSNGMDCNLKNYEGLSKKVKDCYPEVYDKQGFLPGLLTALKSELRFPELWKTPQLKPLRRKQKGAILNCSDSSLVLVGGNLCRQGGWVKLFAENRTLQSGVGRLKIFESPQECAQFLQALSSKQSGQTLVLLVRGCGAKSSAGLRRLTQLEVLLAGCSASTVLLTDGWLCAPKNVLCFELLKPESCLEGSLLRFLKQGDVVVWDVQKRSLQVRLTTLEIHARQIS